MNHKAFGDFKKQLVDQFMAGCEDAVDIIKSETPIDTQRLFASTRIDFENSKLNKKNKVFTVKIIAGGVKLYGIRREQNIAKEVDYAIYVERRDGYIESNLPHIKSAILEKF